MLGIAIKRGLQAGDTLIEVLFAITVFSLIVVTALSIMNQGTATSQRSLEITLVRQQIDSQAETLRFLHDSYVENYQTGQTYNLSLPSTSPAEEFYRIIDQVKKTAATSASQFASDKCNNPPSGSFVLDTRAAKMVYNPTLFQYPDTYAQLAYDSSGVLTASKGIWIEAVRSVDTGTGDPGYIDFHIRACWDTPGLSVPMNLGTIVRLYEPRG